MVVLWSGAIIGSFGAVPDMPVLLLLLLLLKVVSFLVSSFVPLLLVVLVCGVVLPTVVCALGNLVVVADVSFIPLLVLSTADIDEVAVV